MRILHVVSAVVALAAVAAFIGLGAVSQDQLNPDLDWRGRVRVWVFPYAAKSTDFTPLGWRLRKGYWLSFGIAALASLTFLMTRRYEGAGPLTESWVSSPMIT